MTTTDDLARNPFRIHILHHRDSKMARHYRRAIFTWFHGDPGDLQSSGLPVDYRSGVDSQGEDTHPPLAWQHNQRNLLIVLIDGPMVIDPGWRRVLGRLGEMATREARLLLCPVVLDNAAYNVPKSLGRVNFLRMDRADDDPDMDPDGLQRLRTGRLLSLLTQVASRYLLNVDRDGPGGALQLFISHAKGDGTAIARRIRDQIYNQGQIQAFFDESDLPVGHGYSDVLDSHAGHISSALLVVLTDQYASRPWCRREIELARQPRKRVLDSGHSAYLLQPVVVVDALCEGDTRLLAELGQCLVYRWREDNVSGIIDRVLREVLVSAYHSEYATLLAGQPRLCLAAGHEQVTLTSFSPDPALCLALLPDLLGRAGCQRLLVPDPGLGMDEQQRWRQFLPDLRVESFGEASRRLQMGDYPSPTAGTLLDGDPDQFPLIGMSISGSPRGDSRALEDAGCGDEHLHLAMIRIARLLLRHDYNLAYGGDLRPDGFTARLFDLCRMEQADKLESDARDLWTRRMVSFLAWPYYRHLSPTDEGALMNLCRFVKVTPATSGLGLPTRADDTEQVDYLASHYLSFMRGLMTHGGAQPVDGEGPPIPALQARILLGGKVDGYAGIMPGLFEEALLAWERPTPLPMYILGGFGGAAQALAEALLDSPGHDPRLFSLDHHRCHTAKLGPLLLKHERDADTSRHYLPARRYEQLGEQLARLAAGARQCADDEAWPGLANGLSLAENRQLMTSRDLTEIEGLLLRGLGRLAGPPR